MSTVISVENLSKAYRLGQKETQHETLMGALTHLATAPVRNFRRLRRLDTSQVDSCQLLVDSASNHQPATSNSSPSDLVWALRDVSFEVKEGEVVGIIGRNGAGKSTLLKILSRITEPTSGRAVIRGRVGSLLEVGTGFHPELTGRENVYMNGTILGMTKRETDRKFDDIVDFSGVERFLDTPIKHYSSGMQVRLAFAVAAHLDPEILIVDEVLAVGDAEFQRKCLGKMEDVASHGRTVLFVSHNMAAIRTLTHNAIYLSSGQLQFIGETSDVIDRYLNDAFGTLSATHASDLGYFRRSDVDNSSPHFERVWIATDSENSGSTLSVGETFTIHAYVRAKHPVSHACLSFRILNQRGENVATFLSKDLAVDFALAIGINHLNCTVRDLPLAPGRYTLNIGLNSGPNAKAFDVLIDYPAFEVVMPELSRGELTWPHRPWGAVHWSHVHWASEIVDGSLLASGGSQCPPT